MNIKIPKITHNRLLELIQYNPLTGILIRNPGPRTSGRTITDPTERLRLDGEYITPKRIIMFYMTKKWPNRPIVVKDQNIRT